MKQLSSSLLLFILLLLSFGSFSTISCDEAVSKMRYNAFKNYDELRLPSNVSGPESLAFDCDGDGPYTGVYDGRIFKWRPTHNKWVEFSVNSPHRDRKLCDGSTDPNKEPICGRPLGLKFDTKTCNLYIADAYFGLLMVGPNGGVAQQLAISADDDDGVPFKYLNGVDVDEQNGVIYFTETSTVYQRRERQMISLTGDKTGRLLRYDLNSKKVQVMLKGIASANGVALNQDASFLLFGESRLGKISKFWLKGPKAYTLEVFAQFKSVPDNIKRTKSGDFWVALRIISKSKRSTLLQNNVNNEEEEEDVGVKFDEKRNSLEVLDGRGNPELDSISEVKEHNGKLWIGFTSKSYVAVVEYDELLKSSK